MIASNPCIAVFGAGPDGARCVDCSHLTRNGRYPKCDLRRRTHGRATDHRVYWPACARYLKTDGLEEPKLPEPDPSPDKRRRT